MPSRLEKEQPTRRDFLGLAGLWTSGLAIFGSLIGVFKLPKPNVAPDPARNIKIGPPEEYPAGTVKVYPEQRLRVESTASGIAAMSLVCTHLGCVVREENSGGFACPCHGSKFDKNGKVLGGPAPRPLPWFRINKAADGALVVDLSNEVNPQTYFSA